jgi:integrase
VLPIASEIDFPRVRTFLESIARNSRNSKASYETGLKHFQRFLVGSATSSDTSNNTNTDPNNNYKNYNVDSIIPAIQTEGTVNVYELMDGLVSYFVVHLSQEQYIAPTSIFLYVHAVKSYLLYHDIDINPAKFRRKVRLPKIAREDEQPLDASDIRKLLLTCSNRRLKAYLLVLASGGMRANEGLAMRYKDIDFSVSPIRVHIRKEFTKTKVARDIYISDEATMFLKQWLDWKYSEKRIVKTGKRTTTTPMPDDLVFSPLLGSNPYMIYHKMVVQFYKLLEVVGIDGRKENSLRRKITLRSFRRFVKTVISDATNQDYSEWFLGHKKSPYYVKKEHELREIYKSKCMRYLTFLNYDATIESSERTAEVKLLQEKQREIEQLRELDSMSRDAIRQLSERLMQLESRLDKK